MSVPEPERHKGRLEVHVKAQALAAYTAMILKNPKVFDPEIDTELISRMKGCSYRCWRECAGKGDGYQMLSNMDAWYRKLWEGTE